MRITDSMRYNLFMLRTNSVKSDIDRVQEQIATQKKVLRPSDDPVAFSTYVQLTSEGSLYNQFGTNIKKISMYGAMYDTCLVTINQRLVTAKEIAISYASGELPDSLRQSAVNQVKDIIEHLVTLGNTAVGDNYLFAGKRADTPPFQLGSDYDVAFVGSSEVLQVLVGKNETEALGISGNDVFYDADKGINVFQTLKGLMETLEKDNPSQTSRYIKELGDCVDLISRGTACNAAKVNQMEVLREENATRQARYSEIISETTDADLAKLAVEYNSLSTIYQALMSSMSKMESLSILNYLK